MLAAMKIYLSTLGCKLNESEIEEWARRFTNDGHEIVDDPARADYIVLNTCTVTHVAARKSRQMARQLARANPNAQIALTGCFVSVTPDEAKKLPNVALVVPNAEKDHLVERIAEFRIQNPEFSELTFPTSNFQLLTSKTRAFVKIEDGCNMSCTYCIIPIARGKESSRALADVVSEVKSLVDAGYKEIILTGVQISSYRTSSALNLRDLVAAILAETNVPRLRLTSIAPWDLNAALLDLFSDQRLCRHLHLSLQSGADTVLRRMRRPYSTDQFARAVAIAREKIPDVGITTDVIVGFPGESDAEFEQSLGFVRQMQFSRVHVFPYSARSGTVAAELPLQVSDAVKESRVKQMQAVGDASMSAFAAKFIGRELSVLWETQEKDENQATDLEIHPLSFTRSVPPSVWSGYSDNYIRVLAASDANLTNHITAARVSQVTGDHVLAEIAP